MLCCTYALMECSVFVIYRLANNRSFSSNDTLSRLDSVIFQKNTIQDIAANIDPNPYLGVSHPEGLYSRKDLLSRIGDDSEVVVGITGGSVAKILSDDKNAVAKLERILSSIPEYKGKSFRTISLAYYFYKQPQQDISVMLYFLFGGRLDILINLDGRNEVAITEQNQRNQIFYGYPDQSQWRYTTSVFLGPDEYSATAKVIFLRETRQTLAQWVRQQSILHHSVSALSLWEYVDRAFEYSIDHYQDVVNALQKSPSHKTAFVNGPFSKMDDAHLVQASTDLWYNGSLVLQQLSELYGFKYYHFLQPTPAIQNSKLFSKAEQPMMKWPRAHEVSAYTQLIESGERLRLHNVNWYDLTQMFHDVPDTMYIDECCHVNKEGNIKFAEDIATIIAMDLSASQNCCPLCPSSPAIMGWLPCDTDNQTSVDLDVVLGRVRQ